MEEKKLELAIRSMVAEVNLYSRYVEKAKIKNLPMIEQDYFSRILGIGKAISYFGYTLEEDERRVDCGAGIEPME